MTVYLDLEFILNSCYDLLLLMTVDVTLKRNTKFIRLILASLLGGLSILILFLPFNKYILFVFKIIVSILMILIAYSYKDIKYTFNNIFYLYMCSVILGGFLYFLNIEFSYKRNGLVFFYNGLSINYILLLIIGPIILYLYIKQNKNIKRIINYKYRIKIVLKDNKEINCIGYLDTANNLKDPITKKRIILIYKDLIEPNIRSPMYVPYHTLNKQGLLKCYSIHYIEINNRKYYDYLIGISNNKFKIDGVNCILNNKIMEDLCLEK